MKFKTLALSVAILAVLSAVACFLQRPPAPADADSRIGQPLLDVKAVEKAARIRLTDQGKAVVLARQPDGKWLVPSYYDLPADFTKLGRFIDDLATFKIQRLVTQNPGRLARLEFKDTTIALLDPAGHALWTLTLGKDAEGGGRFVRFDDEKKAYLANLSLFIDSTPKNWTDSLLVDLKPDDISGVEIRFGYGAPVTATRAKMEDAWVAGSAPAGQRIKGDRITSLLSSFTSLRFEDTSELTDANVEAARKHSRTVILTTFDHKTINVDLGRKPEEKIVKPAEAAKTAAKSAPDAAAGPKPLELEPAASTADNAGSKGETAAGTSMAALAASAPAKPEGPKTETIPAGPVYAFITNSDPAAPINALMKKRAFQIYDWNFTSLPQKRDELFEPLPTLSPAEKKPDAKPAEPVPATKPAEKPAEAAAPKTPAAPSPSPNAGRAEKPTEPPKS
jgi:hypothetical protein